jgi:hypothetical protein
MAEDVGCAGGVEEPADGRWEGMTKLNVQGILSLITVLGLFGIGGGLFFFNIVPDSEKYFIIILTLIVAKVSTIYDYYFGSSQSSAVKNETIANLSSVTPIK